MAESSAALAVAELDKDVLRYYSSSHSPSVATDIDTSSVAGERESREEATTPAVETLFAVGILVSAIGILLDCATLHVVRTVRFSGRAATAPAVRLALVSLCCADLLLAVGTLLVCASEFAERNGKSKSKSQAMSTQAEEVSFYERRAYCVRAWAEDLWMVGVHANLFTLLIAASEHAAAVRWPFASERLLSGRRIALALSAAWLCSVAVGLVQPMAAIAANVDHPDVSNYTVKGVSMMCYQRIMHGAIYENRYVYDFGQAKLELSQVGLGLALMIATFACLTIAYGYMFCVVRRMVSKDRRLSRPSEQTSVAAAGGSSRSVVWQGSKRVVMATFSVTALFLVSYAPLLAYNMWRVFNAPPSYEWLYAALFAIVSVTSVSDPLVYAWRLKEVRSGFVELVRRCQPGKQRLVSRGSRGSGGSGRDSAAQRLHRGDRDAYGNSHRNALAVPLLRPPMTTLADGLTTTSAPLSQTSTDAVTMVTDVAH